MKGAELSDDVLEDVLAYDDLFLDYFNAFLSLPVFPQALYYNRLTGAFEEVNSGRSQTAGQWVDQEAAGDGQPHPYGPTDEEREKMLQWAKQDRLPLFLSTQLFRELKLCKLLLRPLDERHLASRGGSSHMIRGYSRQSESCVSSLSNSADNNGNTDVDDSDGTWSALQPSAFYHYDRPGSRALSVPVGVRFGLVHHGTKQHTKPSPVSNESEFTSSSSEVPDKIGELNHYAKQNNLQTIMKQESQPDIDSSGEKVNSLMREETSVSFDPNTVDNERQTSRKQMSHRKRTGEKHTGITKLPLFYKDLSRAASAPLNYRDYHQLSSYTDFDGILGTDETMEQAHATFILFEEECEEEVTSEEQTETDMKNLEGRLQMTLQQMKEHVLGTYLGMEVFKQFLSDTKGFELVNFWLDCEYFKDTMQAFDDVTKMDARNRLFRDIQDKYRFHLTQEAQLQISMAGNNIGLSHTIFLRAQYDILRRIRTYWLPRFLLHLEKSSEFLRWIPELCQQTEWKAMPARDPSFSMFPSLSLVNSLSVHADDLMALTQYKSWDYISKGGRHLDDKVHSAHNRQKDALISMGAIRERLVLALMADRIAGGPFQHYLLSLTNSQLLNNLLFYQDVTEYGAAEDRSADRLLRLAYAWRIFITYLTNDAAQSIGFPKGHSDLLESSLVGSTDFIEVTVFDAAKAHAIECLESSWLRFLQEDLKKFLDCGIRLGFGERPPSTAAIINITVTPMQKNIMINRPRPWARKLTAASREVIKRGHTSLSLAETVAKERREEKKREALERRKHMEKERRKAIIAARQRQRDAKTKKKEPTPGDTSTTGQPAEEETVTNSGDSKPVCFNDVINNKQIVTMFKKFSQEQPENKAINNTLQMYLDIMAYQALNAGRDTKGKKDTQANMLYKNYLDEQSKRHISLPDKLASRLAMDKDRPKSPVIKELISHIQPRIDETFKLFLQGQAESLGMDSQSILQLSQSELVGRLQADAALIGSWKKKTKSGKTTGRAQPSKDDKADFLIALNQSATSQLMPDMLYFCKYLIKHGDQDSMPLIDKDLVFYVEVQKFKDCSHAYSDDEMLRRKVHSIIDCFLESSTGPPTCQIDVSSELHQRTLKAAVRYVSGKEVAVTIFDEAQYSVFRELLPYWAGFKKTYKPPEDPSRVPTTKVQKILRRRLDAIENYEIPKPINFTLPTIPSGGLAAYTFSLNDGVKWRDLMSEEGGLMVSTTEKGETSRAGRRTSMATSCDSYRRMRRQPTMDSSIAEVPSRNKSSAMAAR